MDDSSCPLCQGPNQCAMSKDPAAPACWCVNQTIAPEVLERIPPAQRRKVCICPRCAAGEAAEPKRGDG